MSALLDGELPESERAPLQTHLDTCARCRTAYEALAEIDRALSQDTVEPPAALRENTMRAIRAEKKRKKPRTLRAVLACGLIAAALALVILSGLGVIDLPGFDGEGRANVSIGQALHHVLDGGQKQEQAQQAQTLADERGCTVLALWTEEIPAELADAQYETVNGARVYTTDAETAQAIEAKIPGAERYAADAAGADTVCVVLFS